MLGTLRERANAPVDATSLAAFRFLFGALMVGAVLRYFAMDWIDQFYVQPQYRFHYLGFGWVEALPHPWIDVVFALVGVAAACIAFGLFYRAATVVFLVGFSYVALLDVTRYLNHYYLVVLVGGLLCLLPLHRVWSLDARRDPSIRAERAPAWMLWLMRFQFGVVYVFAGLAKVGPDWLLHAQPLSLWLSSRTELPLVGPLLELTWVPLAMSWAGCLYDLTVPFWLSWRRSRPFAFAAVCTFHGLTHLFFNIGIFPFLMTIGATLFFAPDWPRELWAKLRRTTPSAASPAPSPPSWRLGRWGAAAIGAYVLVQVLVPLRTYAYGGDHLWHEQGMRWGWRVMVREKNGSVLYRVTLDDREVRVAPEEYLTLQQEMEFSGQPDLILQLAHRIRDDFEARGHERVEVRVDAWVSYNGRPSARIIDPSVDLARVRDGFGPADWILPVPEREPGMQLAEAR